jgi:eukaryotic-like serine/threonine-protein kinase
VTPERWSEVQQRLEVALSLTIAERRTFLECIGTKDEELRRELESLLASDKDDPDFMGTPAVCLLGGPPFESGLVPNSMLGRTLGAYTITGQLGVGGMGEVYLAVRADGQYDQQVAVKIVRPGLGEFSSIRFRNERQILAKLDHPNIAKILDGGTTEDKLPYFVMEFIDGVPITDHCDRNRLSIEERFRLFRTVCSAVHYAHQHLIVHRDIKPTNIFVTPEGVPKLLDFGIAKMLSPDSPVENATMTGFWAMTPEYASPEQLRGEPITTAADVYSLGLVLYELLTGQRAHRFSSRLPHEMAQVVLASEPAKPSSAVFRKSVGQDKSSGQDNLPEAREAGPGTGSIPSTACDLRGLSSARKLHRRLAGDADNIVLRALRKETAGRYVSADQLSEDIRRHLEGRPITASKGTTAYRLRKYVVRHKVAVASAALIFLTLVSGIVTTLREARIAQRNELRAERRFHDVRKLANSLLFDIHDSVKDLPGSTPARKLIIQNALQYLDSLSSEAGGDSSLQRELATAYERVGEVQGHYLLSNLGETGNALHSYQKALQLRQNLSVSSGATWQDELALARCHRLVATQLQATGNVHDASENMQKAIAVAELIHADHLREPTVLSELGLDYEINGNLHRGHGATPGLVGRTMFSESYRKALAVDEEWLKLEPTSESAQHAVAVDERFYADTLGPDKRDEALRYYELSVENAQQIAARSTSIQLARDVAVAFNELGMFYDQGGDYAKALDRHQRALLIYQDLARKDPQNKLLTRGMAIDHANISEELSKLGRESESSAESSKAIDLMESLVRPDMENAFEQGILAAVHVTRAENLRRAQDSAAALRDYSVALGIYRNLMKKDDSNTSARLKLATCNLGMGKAEMQLQRLKAASTDFLAALETLKPMLSSDNPDDPVLYAAADAYAILGNLERKQAVGAPTSQRKSHWAAAETWLRASLEQLSRIHEPRNGPDDDGGPIDSAQIRKELVQCEAELRRSGH